MNSLNGGLNSLVVAIRKSMRLLSFFFFSFVPFFGMCCFSAVVFSSEHRNVFVSAKKAEQQERVDRYVLEGDVFIIFGSWTIKGQSGYLEGPLDDPNYINVSGEPVSLTRGKNQKGESFVGFGRNAQLDLSLRIVSLKGEATLTLGNQKISSDTVSYSMDTNMFSTKGRAKVRVGGISSEKD